MLRFGAPVLLFALLSACSASSRSSVVVSLRTDLVSQQEFAKVRLTLMPVGSDVATQRAEFDATAESYADAARVGELGEVAAGTYRLEVALLGGGEEEVLSERPVLLQVRGSVAVTVPIFRSCLNVECGDEQACFGGQCVDLRCSVESEEFCGVASECSSDAECAPAADCAVGSCELGVCWNFSKPADATGACDPDTQWCDPDTGCQLQEGVDAAPTCDDGVQNGDELGVDCGPSCERCPLPPEIYAGSFGVCVRRSDERVFCWGANSGGNFLEGAPEPMTMPHHAPHMDGANDIDIYDTRHPCATLDGQVFCRASENVTSVLGTLALPTPVDFFSAEGNHRCGIVSGTLYCWGNNADGEIGIGELSDEVPTPTQVGGVLAGLEVGSVALSGSMSCAIAQGQAYCWGKNPNGRLGIGIADPTPVPSPTLLQGGLAGKVVDEITGGDKHACARAGTEVYCWGRNNGKQGGGVSFEDQLEPIRDGRIPPVNKVISRDDFNCALGVDGRVHCWGVDNGFGQIGSTSAGNMHTNTLPDPAVDLALGNHHGCALTASERVFCWGNNTFGQLGQGDTEVYEGPVEVVLP